MKGGERGREREGERGREREREREGERGVRKRENYSLIHCKLQLFITTMNLFIVNLHI